MYVLVLNCTLRHVYFQSLRIFNEDNFIIGMLYVQTLLCLIILIDPRTYTLVDRYTLKHVLLYVQTLLCLIILIDPRTYTLVDRYTLKHVYQSPNVFVCYSFSEL